jgi:nucleoside-diphosphate-sugar epimerase
MKVFVTGATGFTGSRTVPLLLSAGYEVTCLYRHSSDRSFLPHKNIHWVLGDVADRSGLTAAMTGCDVLVNIASLGFGHAENIVAAALEAGIRRTVFISTTAIFTQLNAASKSVRLDAESTITNSGLVYTILRPTMIYGSPRDRNIWRLIKWLKILPIIPILGNGRFLQQPIYVDDVAQAILFSLQSGQTVGKCYNIAGKQAISYDEVIDTIGNQLNRRVLKIHFPANFMVKLLKFLEKSGIRLPIKSEQVERLNENKNFSYDQAKTDFDFNPRSFSDGIKLELTNGLKKI